MKKAAKFYNNRMEQLMKAIDELQIKDLKNSLENYFKQERDKYQRHENSIGRKIKDGSKHIKNYESKISVDDNGLYSCNHCNYKVNNKGSLKKHQQSIHEGIRYKCKQCEYKATEKSNLRRHERLRHVV